MIWGTSGVFGGGLSSKLHRENLISRDSQVTFSLKMKSIQAFQAEHFKASSGKEFCSTFYAFNLVSCSI